MLSVFSTLASAALTALGFDPTDVLEVLFNYIVQSVADALEGVFSPIFEVIVSPVSFDFARDLTLGFQGAALAIVFVIIVGRGITRGVIGSAVDDDTDLVHYIYKSLVPIGVIIIAPSLTSLITSSAEAFVSAVIGDDVLDAFCQNLASMIVNGFGLATTMPSGAGLIIGFGLTVIIVVSLFSCTLEIAKRWIELALLSIIVPFSAITTAIDDSSDILTVLKTMVGVVITITLQILLLVSAAAVCARGVGSGSLVGAAFTLVALMSAVKALPQWMDRFTYAGSVGGRGGGGGTYRAAMLIKNFIPKGGK